MALTYLGTISKPHGIQGECFVSDVDLVPHIAAGTRIHLGYSVQFGKAAVLEKLQPYRNGALIRVRGVDTVEKADELRELGVFVDDSSLAAEERDLLGSSLHGARVVIDATGEVVGDVREVWSAPAHRTLVIDHADGHEVLVPLVPSIVVRVSDKPHEIRINPPEGLLGMNVREDSPNGPDDDEP
ncbi:MAG: ribosome maturation factor RimM [Candidatus Kapaibacterium sp.]